MKKYLYILLIAVIPVLSGCYDSDYVSGGRMATELTTLPATLSEDGMALNLHGKSSGRSDYLYFEISQSKDFPKDDVIVVKAECGYEGEVNASVSNWFHPGINYIRLYAENGGERINAGNIEQFSFENPLVTYDAIEITERGARLRGFGKYYGAYAYFRIAFDKEFSDSWEVRTQDYDSTDDGTVYWADVNNLQPGHNYYVKLCVVNNGILIEGNTIEFATEKSLPLTISSIFGETADGERIKMDLMIYVQDKDANIWYGPFLAYYSEEKRDYVFKEQPEFDLNPEGNYIGCAINADGSWNEDFGQVLVNYINPIYIGDCEFKGSSPTIKIGMREWSARLTVKFPKTWGKDVSEVIFEDVYGNSLLTDYFQLPNMKPIEFFRKISCKSSQGVGIEGDKYTYSINTLPFDVPGKGYVNMIIKFENKSDTIPCPVFNLKSGESKVIDINGLDINDVTVDTWEESQGGNIVITPKQ